MKLEEKAEARRLRKSGLSVTKIAKVLSVSRGSVSLWVRDIPLTAKQSQKLRGNSLKSCYDGRIAGAKKNQELAEERRAKNRKEGYTAAKRMRSIHAIGCMLYWAEGRRKNNNTLVEISNSNPNFLLIFIKFLKECFGLTETDLRIRINYYTDVKTKEEIESYWLSKLKLPSEVLRKGVENYYSHYTQKKCGKSPYGTCTLAVNKASKYLHHIYGALDYYTERLAGSTEGFIGDNT